MARLTRAQSQARTRELLIAAARTLFLRDGFARTSLEEVAETAGFSRGAVYSNFVDKDELCLAVLTEVFTGELQAVSAALTRAGGLEARLRALEGWAQRMIGEQGWTALGAEFAAHARHDPDLRVRLAEFDAQLRATLGTLLAGVIEDVGIAPVLEPDVLATAVLSLAIGLGMQRAVDPTVPVRVLIDATRQLIGSRPTVQRGRRKDAE